MRNIKKEKRIEKKQKLLKYISKPNHKNVYFLFHSKKYTVKMIEQFYYSRTSTQNEV